jgi:hypothetical protein
MTVTRVVPNIRSDQPSDTRTFFVDLFGFDVAMDLGWVTTLAAPDHPSVQITIVGGDDMAAPGITVEVPDVDAVHAIAVRRARPRDRLSPARRGLGGAPIHAP